MKRFAPGPRLAPFVRGYSIIETGAGDLEERVLLPEPGIALGLRFRGHAKLVEDGVARRLSDHTLTGFRVSTRRMQTAPQSAIVVCLFHETGAAALFREPLHELFAATIDADALIPRAELARIGVRLAVAGDDLQRIAIVEQFLAARIQGEPDPVVAAAVRALRERHGRLEIRELAKQLGISIDPFEKRFRRVVGATPKQLATLLRLRLVIARGRAPQSSWTRAAIDAGYFDQAHFNRDFRALTGDAPTRFFRDTAWC